MQKRKYFAPVLVLVLTFYFLISLSMPLFAENTEQTPSETSPEELTPEEIAKKAFKEDMADPFHIDTVESAYLYCLSTETELLYFEKNSGAKLNPGEAVKLLTALTAYDLLVEICEKENIDISEKMNRTVTVTSQMVYASSGNRYGYARGDTPTYYDLFCTLVMRNTNDSAIILANTLCESTAEFTMKMNEKAAQYGITDSYFANPTGEYDSRMLTTAKDIFKISYNFYENSFLMDFAGGYSRKVSDGEYVYNRNFLKANYYNNFGKNYIDNSVSGMVAGYLKDSGDVIVRSAVYDGYEYICVVLGGVRDAYYIYSYDVSGELIKWGSKSYSLLKLLDSKTPVASLPVKNARESDSVPVVPSDDFSRYLLSDSFDVGRITTEIKLTYEELTAPLAKGTEVGEIALYYNGELIFTSKLRTACNISENTISSTVSSILAALSSKDAINTYIIIASCVALYVLVNSMIRYRRRKKLEKWQ